MYLRRHHHHASEVCVIHARGLEDGPAVEDDGVDAAELLTQHDAHTHNQREANVGGTENRSHALIIMMMKW